MASPVKLAGPGNHRISPSSSRPPSSGSRNRRSAAWRGGGTRPARPSSTAAVADPDRRITAIPAGPEPEASAKIVSLMDRYSTPACGPPRSWLAALGPAGELAPEGLLHLLPALAAGG